MSPSFLSLFFRTPGPRLVHVLLLGTAAGGGFPQWNCWCRCCRAARDEPQSAWPRTQSSAAISRDGHHWFLLNASPDIRAQLARLPSAGTPTTLRHVPVEGVLLTDAELDHSLGLVLLREGRRVPLYSTSAVRTILEDDSHILPVTRAFAEVAWTELPLEAEVELALRDGTPSGLVAQAFAVPADPPRFAAAAGHGHTVGLFLREADTGRACAFVPGCGDLSPALLDRLRAADIVLFDGTFWSDEEPVTTGIGTRTARQMDHVPISGPGGSLTCLAALPVAHRVYTHINNTNPILLERSAERAAVTSAGVTVGYDGLQISV